MSSNNKGAAASTPWIVVADHARARLFSAATPTAPLSEVEDLVNAEARLHDADRAADKSGRLFGGATGGHGHHSQSAEPHESPKQRDADRFARRVCECLEKHSASGAINKLYVIAEPDFLGMLRQHMSTQVRKHVAMELDKDLTRQTAAEIRGALPVQL
jgi:protein required for attachment to host cells